MSKNSFDKHLPKPILVSGSHRSGSTWVGRMIAAYPSIGYIHEPFNVNHSKDLHHGHFKYWFTYITNENQNEFLNIIKDSLEFRSSLWRALASSRTPLDIKIAINRYIEFRKFRINNLRPLIKDPIAVFSVEWLVRTFNMDVLLLIRHPAAFASSLKTGGNIWEHDFCNFIAQPLLMRDILFPFESEIRKATNNKLDIIDQAILLWNLIHYQILLYRNLHPEWNYIRHEDISCNPIDVFQSLYKKLGIEFGEHERSIIIEHSFDKGQRRVVERTTRNSFANISAWKARLTATEIQRVRAGTYNISNEFYSEEEW